MKEELTKLTKEYFEIKEQIDKYNEQQDEVKAKIKLYLMNNNLDREEDLNGNVVTFKSQTRLSVDRKKVELMLGEKFTEVLKTSTFDSLRITTPTQMENIKKLTKNGGK